MDFQIDEFVCAQIGESERLDFAHEIRAHSVDAKRDELIDTRAHTGGAKLSNVSGRNAVNSHGYCFIDGEIRVAFGLNLLEPAFAWSRRSSGRGGRSRRSRPALGEEAFG